MWRSSFLSGAGLLILLVSLLLLACQQPQAPTAPRTNAVLSGAVVNLVSGAPVANAEVSLCYHKTEMLKEGLWIGTTACETPEVLATTGDNGRFDLPIFADTTGLPAYVWVRVAHPDFEVLNEVYIPVIVGENELGEIGMRRRAANIASKAAKSTGRKRALSPRKGEVFVHPVEALRARFPAEKLAELPSVSDRVASGQYVRFAAPVRGYNARPAGFRPDTWDAWHTLLLPVEVAVAGVVEGEVGLFTDHPEALRTQAVWARTYALHKGLNERLPQNFQLAFSTTIAESSLCAAQDTEGQILSHDKAPGGMGFPLLAVFSARCNGDFTQSGQTAKWSGCELGGAWNPYLLPVECSRHPNCKESGLGTPCCNIDPYWERYLYGHGAGGCQQGMKDFAEGNFPGGTRGLSHTLIAPYYFQGARLVPFYGDVWNMPKPWPKGAGR